VILAGHGPAADAKRRLLERAGAVIVGPEESAALAIVADDDPALVARLKQRGVLVNVVDWAELCDFTLPATVDRDPVLVAIGTGGVSAGLAAVLRQRLEAILPAGLGRLAEALHGARTALRAHLPDVGERRRFIGGLLSPGGPLDPLIDHPHPVVPLSARAEMARIERIAVRSADPDELSLRAARLLALADRIHHPADMPPAILDRARADAERIAGEPGADPGDGLTVLLQWERP
jgi:uroporphyrin-III C-methyltransferase / precorrin-2 dehydrogenase / sirohydrochlorin ferrochelatase